jgi:DNA-binding transcriptional LysR family regulator
MIRNIGLRQLRAFVTVAHERSFTRAAARLHLSPSALTASVREMEREIGLRLFDRSTRSVELTAHAAEFLPVAQRLIDELGHALDDLCAVAEQKKGLVVVGATASFITVVLAPALAVLARKHPGIAVRVVEDTSENLASRIMSGELDFGITTLWRPLRGMATTLLLRDRFGVLASRAHPLAAAAGPLEWPTLRSHPLISLEADAGITQQLYRHPELSSLLVAPAYEASSASVLHALVTNDVGIAIVPALMAPALHPAPPGDGAAGSVGAGAGAPGVAAGKGQARGPARGQARAPASARASTPSRSRLAPATRSTVFRPMVNPTLFREIFLVRSPRRAFSPAALALCTLTLEMLQALPFSEHVFPERQLMPDDLVATRKRDRAAGAVSRPAPPSDSTGVRKRSGWRRRSSCEQSWSLAAPSGSPAIRSTDRPVGRPR